MAGLDVSRSLLDARSAEAVIAVREAFEKVETVAKFLANLPNDPETGDPLTLSAEPTDPMDPNSAPGKYGYNADEAYLLRYVFESLNAVDISAVMESGRKLTGLE